MDMHYNLGLEKEVPALHVPFGVIQRRIPKHIPAIRLWEPVPMRRTPVETPNSGTKFRPRVTHFAFLFRTDSSPNVGTPSTIANLARHSR